MPTKTPNPEKAVSAAFDSVNLINKLVLETADDKKKVNVDRNVKHLELMLTKEFFADALTAVQKDEIEACIAVGNMYTA
jgi:hypothetical protein